MKNRDQNNQSTPAEMSTHERLCAFLLGELAAADVQALKAELERSEDLREEHDRIAATIALLRSSGAQAESLAPAIMSKLELAAAPVPAPTLVPVPKSPWYASSSLQVAAGVAALVTGVLGGRALMKGEEGSPARTLPKEEHLALNDRARMKSVTDQGEAPRLESRRSAGRDYALEAAQGASLDPQVTKEADAKLRDQFDDKSVMPTDASRSSKPDRNYGFEALPVEEKQQLQQELAKSGTIGGAAGEGAFGSSPKLGELSGSDDFFLGRVQSKTGDVEATLRLQPEDVQNKALTVHSLDKSAERPAPVELVLPKLKDGLEVTAGIKPTQLNSLGYVGGEFGVDAPQFQPSASAGEARKPELAATARKSAAASSSPGPSGPSAPTVPTTRAGIAVTATPGAGGGGAPATLETPAVALDAFRLPPYADRRESKNLGPEAGKWSVDFAQMTPVQIDEFCAQRTKSILDSCSRVNGERPSDMFFRFWGDNPFELTRLDKLSTFSVDVDTASYALARRYLNGGNLPTKAQIRTEEFVNYFKPDLAPPTESVFAIHTELAASRFGNEADAPSQRWMLRVGVRGREVAAEERKPLALTFVVDTSGSMKEGNRLELVKHALRLLVAQMHGSDSIAIVGFNNSASVILPMTSAQNRGVIEAAVYGLNADGGTNAEGGLNLGYEVALAGLTQNAHNRVVLLSDGVANIGQTDQDRVNLNVKRHRDSGIYLNTIGVGMSNHNDVFLEQLANKGDGICNYVDSGAEAKRALVDNFTGAFEPIARDVKIQVEFDESQVYRYRLLGYENRAIADADFRNDAVDAGEVGAGHQVVALYELELTGSQSTEPLAKVQLRWKAPSGPGRDPREDSASEMMQPVVFSSATTWEGAPLGYRRSVLVAQFAEILRRSVHSRQDSLDALIAETSTLASQMPDSDLVEFLTMLKTSRELILRHVPQYDDLTNCIDSIRRNRILRAQYEELRRTENLAVLNDLERTNDELERRIRELVRQEVEQKMR